MATLSYTTTAQEDRALTWYLQKRNANQLADWQARRDAAVAAGQPAPPQPADLTASDIVQETLRGFLTQRFREAQADDVDVVHQAYLNATNTKQQQVKTALGLP